MIQLAITLIHSFQCLRPNFDKVNTDTKFVRQSKMNTSEPVPSTRKVLDLSKANKKISQTNDHEKSPCLQNLAAEWQNEQAGQETKCKLLQNEFLKTMKSINAELKDSGIEKIGLEWMNWDKLYEVSAELMDRHSKEMEEILAELDEVYKKWFMWQEAAFTIDSHRGATRIGKAECWIKGKEIHLEYMKNELDSSAQVIRTTIEGLSKRNIA